MNRQYQPGSGEELTRQVHQRLRTEAANARLARAVRKEFWLKRILMKIRHQEEKFVEAPAIGKDQKLSGREAEKERVRERFPETRMPPVAQ